MNHLVLKTAALLMAGTAVHAGSSLENGFLNPPESTKPWCYWYWISDNISREGITRDLEAMKRVGIGEAFIGNIFLEDVKIGSVKALSEEWWGMVEHAIREGGRLGVEIGMFNCPGWSQSGGPWIKPEQAMRYLTSSERRVKGPVLFQERLPAPKHQFQQVAVLAFPTPREESNTISSHSPSVSCTPDVADASLLVDGDRQTRIMFPAGAGDGSKAFVVVLATDQPFVARSLELVPTATEFSVNCELQVAEDSGAFRTVRKFPIDRSNNRISVGFLPHSPVAVSFPAVKGNRFKLVFTSLHGKAGLAEIQLSSAARVERCIEKQLGKMHSTPLPLWDAYLWPGTAELDSPELAVAPGEVLDLTKQVAEDGTLNWRVPEGDWLILRLGMTPTGIKNSPASPEGQGLEVDKMNRLAAQAHFDAFVGEILRRLPPRERKAFRHVVADSYEMGSQNWTDGFREVFQKRYGYDPRPWLPVLTGRVVGNSDLSDRFLWDLRRLVADHVATDYVGGLREACRKAGLKLWLENYGHWGFPAEFLQYGGQSDEVSGEFWATGDLGSIELRAASSAAHIYGKPIVHAEAFTSVLRFESTPWSLKRRGDWALTEGINHWVLHVNIHQPWEDRRPGVNAWFSTEFNRHNTWFDAGREWIDYYRRCDFLLQQGRHVADVAYFIGEDAPKMTGIRKPELPPGYDFDYINAEVLETRVTVKNGNFTLPDGTTYRLLVLPDLSTMRPELLTKIHALAKAGGSILGNPPLRSPSMQNHPRCDREVQKMAAEMWQGCDGHAITEVRFGKGRVFRGMEIGPVLDRLRTGPDVSGCDPKLILWTHRTSADGEIYFLCNQSEQRARVAPLFRVSGRRPELWDPVGRRILPTAVFESLADGTRVPVDLEPRGSLFVIFRERAGRVAPVIEVRNEQEILVSTRSQPAERLSATDGRKAVNTFTMAGWVNPAAAIALPKESDSGVFINEIRNDAVVAVHGASTFSDPGHACAGISVGQNGICVYEHSGDYFAPLLVCATPITNWTHVAVVYAGGRPAVFLNGQHVHTGLQSHFTVHSSVSFQAGNSSFKGVLGDFKDFDRALDATELAGQFLSGPPGSAFSLPPITLTFGPKSSIQAEISSTGLYTLNYADGTDQSVTAPGLPSPTEIAGSWQVEFPPGRDVPGQITLDRLTSLAEHPDEAVKHFAGTAKYRKPISFTDQVASGRRLLLDLGRVESVAQVTLNGRDLGIVWKPPYILDVTSALRSGQNELVVQVIGTWRNRLIGDAKYANGFPKPDGPNAARALEFKPYLTADLKISPNEALSPYGLLGPVRLLATQTVTVRP